MLHNLCLSFLPSITAVQEKLKTMLTQFFFGEGGGGGVVNKVIMRNVEVVYGRIALAVARSLIVFSGSGIFLVSRPGFGIKGLQEMQDPKNNHWDYGMKQQLGSEKRDNRTLLGTLYLDMFCVMVRTHGRAARGSPTTVYIKILLRVLAWRTLEILKVV